MQIVFQVLCLNFPNAKQDRQAGLAVDRTWGPQDSTPVSFSEVPQTFCEASWQGRHQPSTAGKRFQHNCGRCPEGTTLARQGPEQLCGRYLSRRCTPRRGSPRTRSSRWAPPQWCPSSCLAGSPGCSWKKAPARKEPKQINGASAFLWQDLVLPPRVLLLGWRAGWRASNAHLSPLSEQTFCTIVLPQLTAVGFLWRNTSRDGKADQQVFVICAVLWALQTGMWPWCT